MPTSKPFMKCGHTANAEHVTKDGKRKPCCVICVGINTGWNEIDPNPPDLTGRKSQCSQCKSIVDSDFNLPFFEYRPTKEFDNHYDGCRGWD